MNAVTDILARPEDAAPGAGAQASTRAFTCALARSVAEMAALADEWRALERAHGRDTQAFQSFAWCMAWAETFAGKRGDARPLIVVVRSRGHARLIWPLMRTRYVGIVRAVSWLSDPYCQYGDVLTDLEGEALQEALALALRKIRGARADLLRLRHVRDDAVIAPFLRRRFLPAAEREGAPWLDLTPFEKPEDLDRRYNKNQRRRRKRVERRLREHYGGEVRFALLQDAEDVRFALRHLIQEKRGWLKRKGLVSRALFDPRLEPFLQRLHELSLRDDDLQFVLTETRAGDVMISWEFGLRMRGRHYAYITAQLPTATELSAARLHMDRSQRQAIADGMKVFDLLVPDNARKRGWASDVMPVREYFLPLSWRGQVFGRGYLCHLRPRMRQAYHNAPMGVRRWLKLLPFGGAQDAAEAEDATKN